MIDLMIYGAYGFTGAMISERAAKEGAPPLLAGRDAGKVGAMASRLGMPSVAFDLADATVLRRNLAGVRAVLNCAGPFSRSAAPLVAACLETGTHYVDVTGEIAVFEHLAAQDAAARQAGVVLLPGAGFDVVPSDCLSAHLKLRLPGMTRLRLSLSGLTRASRGTARTALEALGQGTAVRRGGRIVVLERVPRGQADFGGGPVETIGIGWGDVSTAWRSTGVPDIDVMVAAPAPLRALAGLPPALAPALRSAPVQRLLSRLVDHVATGPSEDLMRTGHARLLGEGWDADGARVAALMETPEPYALTACTALALARRVASGEVAPGYHTPATAFGPDLALTFEGVRRRAL